MELAAALIPHRFPWLLVDRVVARGVDEVTAVKQLGHTDPLLATGELPELLLLEALAQAAACFNGEQLGRHRGLLVGVSDCSFAGRPRVGDTIVLWARRTAHLGALVRFRGEARVAERLLASAQLTFAIREAEGPHAAQS